MLWNGKIIHQSCKSIGYQWVCLFVCLFPNSSERADPNELKFWMMIALGLKTWSTVRRKTCPAMEASSGYTHFSSIVGINVVLDHYNFVVAQSLVLFVVYNLGIGSFTPPGGLLPTSPRIVSLLLLIDSRKLNLSYKYFWFCCT